MNFSLPEMSGPCVHKGNINSKKQQTQFKSNISYTFWKLDFERYQHYFVFFWNLSPECFSIFSIFQKAPLSCPVNSL